ncbi:MAG: hypothetical protein P4L33_17840 [Capsulimonadaceae bacterium]|nr:hypothetical protein [Capsulimonadaceae bacterium]
MAEVRNAPGTQPLTPGKAGLGVTQRQDPWWAEWLGTVVGLGILGVYAFVAAEMGKGQWGPYLSPFYSPEFLQLPKLFHVATLPAGIPIALIPLVVILGFRGTCYYYRKAYYRAFFADPAGCAVGEARTDYAGETRWPWLIQNAHRYFMYLATIALIFLWFDTVVAFFPGVGGHSEFGSVNFGLGSFVMLLNVILLSGYTFGCHSLRHLIGGKNDCMSCEPSRLAGWKAASKFNAKHMQWAWASLFWVCATDLYIRLGGLGYLQHVEKWGGWH